MNFHIIVLLVTNLSLSLSVRLLHQVRPTSRSDRITVQWVKLAEAGGEAVAEAVAPAEEPEEEERALAELVPEQEERAAWARAEPDRRIRTRTSTRRRRRTSRPRRLIYNSIRCLCRPRTSSLKDS